MRRAAWAVRSIFLVMAAVGALAVLAPAGADEATATRILLIAGPCDHPPGTHEAAAGVRLLAHCLSGAAGVGPIRAEVYYDWPDDKAVLDSAATVVFIGDIFPPERMERPEQVKKELAAMMDRGCGLVCIHYATGLRAQHVGEDGSHSLLGWLGGYFAAGCPHHRSVARVCTATIEPEPQPHPVLRGWRAFTFEDEPYWNNYFGKDGMAANVRSLAYAMLPPEEPRKETVAWCIERPDGGRGVGIVMPHYLRSWRIDDLRTLVLNAICWTAKLEIPADGVQSTLPDDLSTFEPASVEPKPRPAKR